MEPRHENFLEAEKREPGGIHCKRAGDPHSSRRVELAAFVDDARHLARKHCQSDGGRYHDKEKRGERRRQGVARAVHIALGEKARESRQQDGAERDADDSEGKIHESLGVADHAGGPGRGQLGEKLVQHVIDLHGAGAQRGDAKIAPHQTNLFVQPSAKTEPRRDAGLAHAREHERELGEAAGENRGGDKADAHGDRQAGERRESEERADPKQVQKRRHETRRLEPAERVQYPHAERGAAYREHVRRENRHERERESRALRKLQTVRERLSPGKSADYQNRGRAEREKHGRHDGSGELRGFFDACRLDLAAENRHERRGKRPLAEELSRHVRQRERERERALGDAGPDKPRLEHLAHEPEHA